MQGTAAVLRRIEGIKEAISDKIPKAIDLEAKRLATMAQDTYDAAYYTGEKDITVTSERVDKNSALIKASGTTVLFVEYGTGIFLKHDSQFGDAAAYPPKSWSATHGRWLTNPRRMYRYQGWWPLPHPGTKKVQQWTQGNSSANAMYEAWKDTKDSIPRAVETTLDGAFK